MMEFLLKTIDLLFFTAILAGPFFFLKFINKKNIQYKFLYFFLIGMIYIIIMSIGFSWWNYTSDILLLKYYGYNLDGMSEVENYSKVLPENIEKVQSLLTSVMGIGWPLKAFFLMIPMFKGLIVLYVLDYFWNRFFRNK